ncbi:RPC4 polymerase, partial [Vidua chalybeata]|nr:RPC4 polymerase [Vidua chalybeata]
PREDVSVKKEKKERERQRDGHGRGRSRPEVIQSHSIFEQGPAEMMKKKAGSWDRTVDVSDFGPSHIINIKKEKRETDEETKQILRMLQKDDFLDDPGLKNDIRNKPRQLRICWVWSRGWAGCPGRVSGTCRNRQCLLLASGSALQQLCRDTSAREAGAPCGLGRPGILLNAALPSLHRGFVGTGEKGTPQLVPVCPSPPAHLSTTAGGQLPSSPLLEGREPRLREAKQAENICTLADLPEGQVGKLLIRKSGKVQLVLGKVTLDVTMGTPCSFLQQELVSVGIGDNRTGEMIVLGHVRHKLVCSPDFEALLEHRHR